MRVNSGEFRKRIPALIPEQIKASALEKKANVQWVRQLPSIRTDYEALDALDCLKNRGIPPLLGNLFDLNTKKSAIAISLELLKGLSPASCIYEAMTQVDAVLDFVRQKGVRNRINYLARKILEKVDFHNMSSVEIATLEIAMLIDSDLDNGKMEIIPYFGFSGPLIKPLTQFQDKNQQSIFSGIAYIRHVLIIGRNGAIQILKMPSAEQLIELIKNDDRATHYILRHKPLNNGDNPIIFSNKEELISHLENEILLKSRITSAKDDDVNKIFRNAPFDIPRHIKAGRLKVVIDKVGSNGLTVWQDTHDDFYRILRNEIE